METQVIELSEKSMNRIVEAVVEKMTAAQEKKRRAVRSNAYHNIREVLKNYHQLKTHCKIVDQQVEEEVGSFWFDWRFDVNSLLEHKAKTVKIMKHVDFALIAYKESDPDGYKLLEMKYLVPRPLSDEFIATHYDCDRRTIKRRLDKGIQEVAKYTFGIETVINWF